MRRTGRPLSLPPASGREGEGAREEGAEDGGERERERRMRRRVAAAPRDGTDGCCLRRRAVRFWRGRASRREEGREREKDIFF